MTLYSDEKIASELKALKNWDFVNNSLVKHFQLETFSQAMGFIVQIGLAAEKQNHHPELLNVYNKLTICLSTHEAKGVTKKDFDLAFAIDQIK